MSVKPECVNDPTDFYEGFTTTYIVASVRPGSSRWMRSTYRSKDTAETVFYKLVVDGQHTRLYTARTEMSLTQEDPGDR